MAMLTRLVAAARGLVRRRRAEREADDELQFHLEMEIETHIARGLSADEARRRALRDLGGVAQVKEAVRDVRTICWSKRGEIPDMRCGVWSGNAGSRSRNPTSTSRWPMGLHALGRRSSRHGISRPLLQYQGRVGRLGPSTLLVRARDDATRLTPTVRAIVREL